LDDSNDDEVMSLDTLRLDLQRMILDEASAAATAQMSNARGKRSKQGSSSGGLDYVAAYNLFDTDGNGAINVDEFRKTLFRLKLVDNLPESQVPQLLAMFDRNKKGYINLEDFIRFVSEGKKDKGASGGTSGKSGYNSDDERDIEDDDDDEGGDNLTISTLKPPAAITRNADCDWLCWHIYKAATTCEPNDPEALVSELEEQCRETDISANKRGTISVKELWNLLFELKLRGAMTKEQFEKGILYVLEDDTSSNPNRKPVVDSDSGDVNYEALCRYIIRMGRAFNSLVQEKKKNDARNFETLLAGLLKELDGILKEVPSAATEGIEGYVSYTQSC
jgi:hypothetical protein